MSRRIAIALLLALPLGAPAKELLTEEERIELVRGLSFEYANVQDYLPRSKKPLPFNADGTWDKNSWAEAGRAMGPAARVGDKVQITKVTLGGDRIVLEINGGTRSGKHWYDHVEVGMGTRTTPIGNSQVTGATGTNIEILFHKPLADLQSAEIKRILKPLLDFDLRTATALYSETLPPAVKKAIAEKRAEDGMDKDQVILALGRPDRKVRENKDGDEYEDWIYGKPPGRILFVTFKDDKVKKVKETYAGLGVEAAKPLPVPR